MKRLDLLTKACQNSLQQWQPAAMQDLLTREVLIEFDILHNNTIAVPSATAFDFVLKW